MRWVPRVLPCLLLGLVLLPGCDSNTGLGKGKQAPEIAGTDQSGAQVKLSDYRGKVVVLSFFGGWCGPCRQMLPYEKALVDAFQDKPFQLLAVNTDRTLEEMQQVVREENITWPCIWDEGNGTSSASHGGKICEEWNIHGFPTFYVIDAKGVIRFVQAGGGDMRNLTRTVRKLIEDTEKVASR